jgi:hypothetical protein
MENLLLNHFVFSCLVMGLGIGIDVAIATFIRAPAMQDKSVAIKWVVGVSATHTVFPMVGYVLTYFSLQALPLITPLVGVIAFVLIVLFLVDELKGLSEPNQEGERSYISFALVLAVSWDALWSGPAKSAQVAGWPEWMVWVSFLLVGVVVTVFCLSSLYLAKKMSVLATKWRGSTYSVVLDISRWVQYSVINYFGMLALIRYTFSSDINWLYILCSSFVVMYILLKVLLYRSTFLIPIGQGSRGQS